MLADSRKAWDVIIDAWIIVMDCDVFEDCVKQFECICSTWSLFLDYVKKTRLIPHKEKFFKAWTYRVMHLGNVTSNRYVSISCVFLNVWQQKY